MIVLLYAGPSMFGINYDFYPEPLLRNPDDTPSYRLLHSTLLFHTFVIMNIFNMFNCRMLGVANDEDLSESVVELGEAPPKTLNLAEFNVFARIFSNWWFLIILFCELNIQILMVGYPGLGYVFQSTPITFGMHMTALCLGIGSLIIAAIVKKTPAKWLKMFPELREDASVLEEQKARLSKVTAYAQLPDNNSQ